MIFLFSKQNGALFDGADFMSGKNSGLFQTDPLFYETAQQAPFHSLQANLDKESVFDPGTCVLEDGEAAIIVAHGDGPRIVSEERQNVTAATIALIERLLLDNPGKQFEIFIAACGGARVQAGHNNSLLGHLAGNAAGMYDAMVVGEVQFYGYNAEAGLIYFQHGWVDQDYVGTHIYGLVKEQNAGREIETVVGYDTHVCTQLHAIANPNPHHFMTIIFAPGLETLADVIAWANDPAKQPLEQAYPDLFDTMSPTQ